MSELPNGWAETPMDNLLTAIEAGRSFKCSERPAGPHEWGVIKVSAMTWSEFDEAENKTVLSDRYADPRFEIRSGDLLFSRANTVTHVGAVVQVGETRPRLLLSDKSLRLVPHRDVSPRWLLYYLRSQRARRYLESLATGTSDSMRNISHASLRGLTVPLAPLCEQERIIAAIEEQFSRLDAGIAALSRVRQNLKRMRIAVLRAALNGELSPLWSGESSNHAFLEGLSPATTRSLTRASGPPRGWEWTTLGSICECLDRLRIPVNKKERLHRGGPVPYYGANGQVGWIDDHLFDEPLVLVVEDETFTGREKPFSYKITGRSWVNNHAHVLRPRPGVDIDYLNYALAFYPFTPLTTGTTGRKKLTQRALLGAPLALPPDREQKVIATEIDHRISAISHLEEQVASSLIRASAIRRSILNQAFSGKLVPQDQDDEPASALLEKIVTEPASSNGRKPVRSRKPRGSREEAMA